MMIDKGSIMLLIILSELESLGLIRFKVEVNEEIDDI
jgi:hypothetical protein